jgi:hypothetical protein
MKNFHYARAYPTSELPAVVLSLSAFAFYALAFITFWFCQ